MKLEIRDLWVILTKTNFSGLGCHKYCIVPFLAQMLILGVGEGEQCSLNAKGTRRKDAGRGTTRKKKTKTYRRQTYTNAATLAGLVSSNYSVTYLGERGGLGMQGGVCLISRAILPLRLRVVSFF